MSSSLFERPQRASLPTPMPPHRTQRGAARVFGQVVPAVLAFALSSLPGLVVAQSSDDDRTWQRLPEEPTVAPLSAGSVYPWQEYDQKIGKADALATLGPDLFGDTVDLQSGALSFSITDVSLPGNSGLPVAITRTFSVEDRSSGVPSALPFGDWDIDLPNISGVYGPTWQEEAGEYPSEGRCSRLGGTVAASVAPDAPAGPTLYTGYDYWNGLTANMPGGGELLVADRATVKPEASLLHDGKAPRTPLWLTPSFTYFGCLPNIKNGPGQGFIAITADGTKYWFDWMAQQQLPGLAGPVTHTGSGNPSPLNRKLNALYATKVRDRFGNEVNYTYTNNYLSPVRLTAITSSPETAGVATSQRQITVGYRPSGRIGSVTAVDASGTSRTWTYTYTQESTSPSLSSVVLPDNTSWAINFRPLFVAELDEDETPEARRCTSAPPPLSSPVTGWITHPSGATGTFTVNGEQHRRANVPYLCHNWSAIANNPFNNISALTHYSTQLSLTSKTISGPATPTQSWTYSYGSDGRLPPGTNLSQPPVCTSTSCAEPVCLSPSCAGGGATTVVVGPGSGNTTEWQRYTFGNSYRYNEGKLLKVERGSSASNILQTVTNDYEWAQSGQVFPTPIGTSAKPRAGAGFTSEQMRPEKARTLVQDGVSFNWQARAYNVWGVPTEVERSSSLGYTKRERFFLRDYPAIWTLNQFTNRQDVDLSTQALTTEEVHMRHFPTALVARISHFLVGDYVRWYALDGTLQTAMLANGANVSLQDYFRGVPRRIIHSADNSQLSATLDGHGRIRSVTDALSNTTNYEYDALGRLTQTRFQTGDSTSWSNQDTGYQIRAAVEYGIPAGLWKRTQTRGRYEHVTWFDALWRPILTRERDVNLAGSERFVRKAYDARGNLSFESYPGALAAVSTSYANLSAGTWREYDALNRPTVETRSSEQGNLVSRRDYLSGFQVRDTNARNQVTTTSFMAYDEPTYDWPMQISEPEYKSTSFQRDRWGKPTSITRNGWYLRPDGSWEQNSATRRFVYDVNQRLCKRIDPEHGATVMDYDSANRLAWTADGLNLPSTTECNRESVATNQRVVRSYNGKDELVGIDYPDSTDDLSFTYFADGKPQTASVGPLSNRITRTYSYNKRRLPTQELLQIDGFSFPIGYRYSSEGAVSELGYPDNTWEALSPDGLGRPSQMGQFASNVTWHRFGPLASFKYGNGLSFSQTLNARGLPNERRDDAFGSARLRDTLSWDGNGNLTAINDLVGDASLYRNASRSMIYDGLDRLSIANSAPQPPLRTSTPWTYSWGEARFGYDGLDNIRTFKMGAADFTYAYAANGQLQSVSQAGVAAPLFNYSHNARGQMTGRQFGGQQFTMSWDSAHRVTQTWNAASSVVETYRYDAHGHRVRTVRGGETVYQVYTQGGDLLMERTNAGTTRKYARLGGQLIGETINGARRAIHTDVIGSVRQKSDAFGTLVHEDVRAPYGSTLLGWQYQNGPAFTGHMEDGATGLTYMKARYYDPVAMRFISPDPVYVDLGTGGNFNRYWYANNNPYTYVDPDGRCGTHIQGHSDPYCSSFGGGRQYEVVTETPLPSGAVEVKRQIVSDQGIASDGGTEVTGTVHLLPQASASGDPAKVGEEVMKRLLNFSEKEAQTIGVTSGQRTPAQNAAVGGAPNSQHLHDNAADIRINGYSSSQTAAAAHASGEFNRVNLYLNSQGVHVDLRPTGLQGFFINWAWQNP